MLPPSTSSSYHALGGSVVGFIFGDDILVAWTGTDALHHLNVAMIGV